jgi:hypothetical protein
MPLNIYHVSRTDGTDYDEYSDFVVVAKSEEVAANTHPSDGEVWPKEKQKYRGCSWDWWTRKPVKVTLLGRAAKGVEAGIICSSFHAG